MYTSGEFEGDQYTSHMINNRFNGQGTYIGKFLDGGMTGWVSHQKSIEQLGY